MFNSKKIKVLEEKVSIMNEEIIIIRSELKGFNNILKHFIESTERINELVESVSERVDGILHLVHNNNDISNNKISELVVEVECIKVDVNELKKIVIDCSNFIAEEKLIHSKYESKVLMN